AGQAGHCWPGRHYCHCWAPVAAPLACLLLLAAIQGGAWSAEKDSRISLTNSTWSGNSAAYGGAFSASRDMDIDMAGATFSANTATSHAGALECVSCTSLAVT
ncbi:predicted protein, partial [Haematococcus lacustris]